MRRKIIFVSIATTGALLLWWTFGRDLVAPPKSKKLIQASSSQEQVFESSKPQTPVDEPPISPSATGVPQVNTPPVAVKPLARPLQPGNSVRVAYRLVMEKGQCTLDAIEEVQGSFRPKRVETWAPGMLCFRLLDRNDEVLAEETMLAPDHQCVVLDPNQPDHNGEPQAIKLTSDGPVTFQARFAKVEKAVQLKIYRLSGETKPAQNSEPEGQLLSSIPLIQ